MLSWGVAVNCGPALMGDDIEGICQSVMDIPVCVSDASGFNGDADRGWSDAMISLLRKVPHFSEKKQAGKVNVIVSASWILRPMKAGRKCCLFPAASQ